MGDFRKKYSAVLSSRGKKHAKKLLGKIISCTEKNIAHDV